MSPTGTDDAPTRARLDGWQVRIADESGRVRGSGVLITDRHVLTCAHVLGAGPEPPAGSFVLTFPRSKRQHRLSGTVLPDSWSPDAADDVALLSIDGPLAADVAPARVGAAPPGGARPASVYGQPPDTPDGIWAQVLIGESAGSATELVRVGGPRVAIEPGFSGGGVLDESTGAVVGIVATSGLASGRSVTWMIPMAVVANHSALVRTLLAGPEPPEELSPATLADLRDALVGIPYFRDARTRRLYLDAVGRRMRAEFGVPIEVSPSLDPAADAEALLGACRAVPGSLRMLVKDFPLGAAVGPEVGLLSLRVELVSPERLLAGHERGDLVELLATVPADRLRLAYRRTVPWPATAEAPPTGLDRLVRALEGMTHRPGGLPRVLTFAEQVAAVTDDPVRAGLWSWTDRVAARLRMSRPVVEEVRRALAASAAPPAAPVLTIQLAPDALRPGDRFLLSAVLDADGRRRMLAAHDKPLGLAAVHAALDELLDDVHGTHGGDGRLSVEIVVPRVLLTEPFERYPVILRSFERMRQRSLWPQWERKWTMARRQPTVGSHVMRYIAGGDTVPAREVYRGLQSAESLALVLGGPPPRQRELAPPDAFAAALQAGVAYVIWLREVSMEVEFHAAVQGLLDRVPVRELSDYVTRWRDDGERGEMAFAAHVSIMACDYDRRDPFASRFLGPPRRRD
ncbi:trypsin-like peptidase domain-containing protein [Actinoplanes sp. NPDC026623]|uniref:VMAP-C domain-containing protein n=1 Tax=Actinoplanes sp. NPDC026623 TaxID=3155610 RepID=UPI0033E48EB5